MEIEKSLVSPDYKQEKQQLEDEIQKLRHEAEELQQRYRGPAIRAIMEAMREYDISPEEITAAFGGGSSRRSSRTVHPPKYIDPVSGKTWSGRGRPPKWLVEAEAKGHQRDEFLID